MPSVRGKTSSNVQAVRWCLAELGIAYERTDQRLLDEALELAPGEATTIVGGDDRGGDEDIRRGTRSSGTLSAVDPSLD